MITTTLPPVTGGLETHVRELSRKLVKQGHAVTLIGSRNYQGRTFPDHEEKEGVRIYRVRDSVLPVYYFRYRLYAIRAAILAYKLHRRRPFDIIHAHQIYPCGVGGALLARLRRIPLIITCHGSALFLNWEVPWIRPLMKWTMKRTQSFIAVGEDLKKELIAHSVDPERVTVLGHPIDTKKFSPGNRGEVIRNKFGWKTDDLVIAYLGRMHPLKGPQYIIQLAERILPENPEAKFLLMGTGELEGELREKVRRSGKENSFIFTGEIDHEDVPAHMAAADILVVPSLAEGGGLSAREGMAAGKAVVANRVGGLAEAISDGETGLLIPLDDTRSVHYDYGLGDRYLDTLTAAVKRLSYDSALRKRLGRNARREVEAYHSWEAGIKELLSIYEEVRS